MQVAAILRTKGNGVVTVHAGSKLTEAIKLLNEYNIGAVVAVDDSNAIAGILSERDIVRCLGKDGARALERKVSDLMTEVVVTCTPDIDIAELMDRMTRRRIRHIPVVDRDELIGIISIGDVVKRKIEEAENEAEALREYIAT